VALVILAATIGVPLLVIALGVLWARGAKWAWSSSVRRGRVFLGLGAFCAVVGLLHVLASEHAVWGWVYFGMEALTLFVAWWEGRGGETVRVRCSDF